MISPGNNATASPRMKIVHCLPEHSWVEEIRCENPENAACIQQKYIADGLRARGHSITWLAPQDFHDVCVSSPAGTIVAPRTWTASPWFECTERAVWKAQKLLGIPYLNVFSNLRRRDACLHALSGHDIVLERNSLYNSGAATACRKLGLPYVVFFDADQIAEHEYMNRPIEGLLRWRAGELLRYNLGAARRVICVSKIAKDHLVKVWSVPASKIVVLPNAVDVGRFRPDPEMGGPIRAAIHCTHNPLILFVGSFYPWHDVATLLKAFSIVAEKHSDARLILVGDGAGRESMRELSMDLGVANRVQFIGFIRHSDVIRYINAADIAVVPMPNIKQGMWLSPMKLFEFMAAGRAVVASAIGQIAEVVDDEKNGVLVPPDNEIALANAVIRLIGNPPLRTELGKQARKDMIRHHSWEHYSARLEQVLVNAAGCARFPISA